MFNNLQAIRNELNTKPELQAIYDDLLKLYVDLVDGRTVSDLQDEGFTQYDASQATILLSDACGVLNNIS